MKKLFFMALLSGGMLLGFSSVRAQDHVYVKVRPTAHTTRRPPAPSHNHVWVGSEWSSNNGRYVESPGHWEMPPQGHKHWSAGHWAKSSRGSYWVEGRWN